MSECSSRARQEGPLVVNLIDAFARGARELAVTPA
jgi:hypothetical protein